MLPPDARLISVDDHIIEPPHLWQSRLPRRERERGPRVVELDDGTEAWRYEDQIVQTFRGSTRTRPGFDDEPQGVARFSEMRPGCYDPVARLADMDLDGVWAQVCFPDFARFAGHRFLGSADARAGHRVHAGLQRLRRSTSGAPPTRTADPAGRPAPVGRRRGGGRGAAHGGGTA